MRVCFALLAGCYSPHQYRNCEIGCTAELLCPNDLVCGGDRMCHAAESLEACVDSGIVTDVCWGVDEGPMFRFCLTMPDMSVVSLTGTLDTGTSPLCIAQNDSCIIAGGIINVGTLKVTGPRPLVLAATSNLFVSGELGAAGHNTDGSNPPPPNANQCPNAGSGQMGGQTVGAGGGAGGGYGGSAGGSGGPNAAATRQGGVGSVPVLPLFHGGCQGGSGGNSESLSGRPGNGGGAVYLAAQGMLTVSGVINASGGGPSKSGSHAGGSGGGSGGVIVLWSPLTISVPGKIFALGGGGGSGGGTTQGVTGVAGNDPLGPNMPAAPSTTSDSAGIGGAGGSPVTATTDGGAALGGNAGGGGGGGAVGVIFSRPLIPDDPAHVGPRSM